MACPPVVDGGDGMRVY